MDLPNLFNSNPDEPKLCLSLYLTDHQVQAGLWQLAAGQVAMVTYSDMHSFNNDDDCIKATDESLQELGKESEGIEEVVFGFEPDWIDRGNIADVKKPLLKRLTKELSLRPVGFVVTTEALVQFLSIKEPLFSALVVEITAEEIVMMVVERGNLIAVEQVGKSGDIVADLNEALARVEPNLQQKHLPPKMMLVSIDEEAEELKEKQQAIIGFDWTKDHPFLHQPVVEVQPSPTMIEAVTSQGGKAVAQAQGYQVAKVKTKPAVDQTLDQSQSTLLNPEELGFAAVATSDIDQDQTISVPTSNIKTAASETLAPPESALDEINQFSDEFTAVDPTVSSSFGVPMATAKSSVDEPLPVESKKRFQLPNIFAKKNPAPEFSPLEYVAPTTKKKNSHFTFVAVGVIGGLLILLGLSNWWISQAAVAKIVVTLKTQPVSQDVVLTIDPEASAPDPANLILPGKLVTQTVSGTKSIDTTGVKLIGDRAKGKVTIINKTDGEKTFDKGTVLTTGKLKFSLDETVKVASSSVQKTSNGETKTYGKASANVTASQIGAESNLAEDQELTVASFSNSSYTAVSEAAFSGGSSREIRAVAKTDLTKLRQELTAELQKQAMKELTDQAENGVYYAYTGQATAEEVKFSAEEGDEVNSISLDLTLKVEAVAYQNNDLKPLTKTVLSSQVPAGFQLASSDPQILSNPMESATKSAQVKLQAQLTSAAEPQVNFDEWKQAVAGQKLASAVAILKGKKEVAEVNISIVPSNLSLFVHQVPKNTQKIEIVGH